MFKQWLKEYFSFTKKERRGIVCLLLIMTLVWLLPDLFPRRPAVSATQLETLIKTRPELFSGDSPTHRRPWKKYEGIDSTVERAKKTKPFYFDPNTISKEEWKKLGLRDKTIATIQKWLSRGGRFKEPSDINKIYGLRKEESARLKPFVRIAIKEKGYSENKVDSGRTKPPFNKPYRKRQEFSVDVNTADTADWIALPGIGSKLAQRIVKFRERLGGFFSVDQVGETFGLTDSTFQLIRQFLHCPNPAVKTMDPNQAGLEELKSHPYFRYNLANAIVQNRQQHGPFKSLDDLKRIPIITNEIFEKIVRYLEIKE